MNAPASPTPPFTLLQPRSKTANHWKEDENSYADLPAHSAALA